MLPSSHPQPSPLFIGIVVAVCVLAGSSYAAYQVGYGRGAASFTTAMEQKLPEVRAVYGIVAKISGQEITLTNAQKIPDFSDSKPTTFIITADQSTIVERLTLKDIPAVKVQSATTAPVNPYSTQRITLGDVKVGDIVSAFASEDISKVTAFTAIRIDVQNQSKPTTAPVTPKKP